MTIERDEKWRPSVKLTENERLLTKTDSVYSSLKWVERNEKAATQWAELHWKCANEPKAAGTDLGQQGQCKTKGHFKGQKISRLRRATPQAFLYYKISKNRDISEKMHLIRQIMSFFNEYTLLLIIFDLIYHTLRKSMILNHFKKAIFAPVLKRQQGQLPLRFRRPC